MRKLSWKKVGANFARCPYDKRAFLFCAYIRAPDVWKLPEEGTSDSASTQDLLRHVTSTSRCRSWCVRAPMPRTCFGSCFLIIHIYIYEYVYIHTV